MLPFPGVCVCVCVCGGGGGGLVSQVIFAETLPGSRTPLLYLYLHAGHEERWLDLQV